MTDATEDVWDCNGRLVSPPGARWRSSAHREATARIMTAAPKMREALEFYAMAGSLGVIQDGGRKARAALAACEPKGGE